MQGAHKSIIRTHFVDKTGTNEVRLVADVTIDLMDRAAFFIQLGDLLLETKASGDLGDFLTKGADGGENLGKKIGDLLSRKNINGRQVRRS